MSRRTELEQWAADVDRGYVEESGETIDLIVTELRALWAVKDAARRFCGRPGCAAINHAMSDALDAYEADNA